MMKNVKGRDFLSIRDYTPKELSHYLDTAMDMKQDPSMYENALEGKNLAMIFQKPSLRTRMSFEVGMNQLGGQAQFIGPDEIQLGKREAVKDVAAVLSRYVDGIMARVFAHDDVIELAEHADIPVINGLSDLLHPCQGMADFLTMSERFGSLKGLKLCYVGDGNNVCHSLMYGSAKFGADMTVACPKGYEPNMDILDDVSGMGLKVPLFNDPMEAAVDADVIYTDTWVSMGQEKEGSVRINDFSGFQVNKQLVDVASEDCIVMHCLPAHRNVEISDEVMDGPRSAIFDQAENRLHAQKAIMAMNIG
ncbi:MAG TPA: ornithine carbamoyltransferase [Candidatus Methanofastidiosa archaeon]|nr:ornithine carbamoyltransferase [Candidatus Methanofastidiosa archaeon]